MIRLMLFVGVGGFFGTILRYSLNILFTKGSSPYASYNTIAINVLGCFLLGILVHTSSRVDRDWFLLLTTGLCGGFTTYSTFGIENANYLLNGQVKEAFINITLSLVLGIGATVLGWHFGKIILT